MGHFITENMIEQFNMIFSLTTSLGLKAIFIPIALKVLMVPEKSHAFSFLSLTDRLLY